MPERTCYHCAFSVKPSAARVHTAMMACWSAMMTCVDHPEAPGEKREVAPTSTCRNFRARWKRPVRVEPPAPPNDEVRYIALTQGKFAIVDAADYKWLSRYKWCVSTTGRGRRYACRMEGGRMVSMHRMVMNAPKGMVVDHIDGNGLNNRRCNLRLCTPAQNMCNRGKYRGKSRYKGVFQNKRGGSWYAKITSRRECIHLGTFKTEIEAARAYDRKALELFGQFARVNFPEEHPGSAPDV